MSKIYIVDIEAVDTRYTKQWKEHLPNQLKDATGKDVVVISGGETPQATTPGAFLNFGGTNVYKSNQLMQIGEMFCEGKIETGDYFLYTDAWNPTVLQLRYMAELLGVDIHIGGMWHAGSYDPHDFLGRLIGNKPWVRHTEAAMFECYNHNFFATNFHIDLFCNAFNTEPNHKFKLVGWPMEYLQDSLDGFEAKRKKNKILFPHRIAPEKQPEIFRDLAESMPEYEFVMCQEQELTKEEYHKLLGEAKLVFSANLQETLGISWYEGSLVGTLPMVPDRLSYSEMALEEFKYPSEWTENWDSYVAHKEELIKRIKKYMKDYKKYLPALERQRELLHEDFFSGAGLYMVVDHHI
jgi:hypothetical protein